MKIAIIGFGSIGKRHAEIFKNLGADIVIVSSQEVESYTAFKSFNKCFEDFCPQKVLICNKTCDHQESLDSILETAYEGPIFIEKPVFAKYVDYAYPKDRIHVLYNFRFHPGLIKIKNDIGNDNIISLNAYVGQYLPTWRPGVDYAQSYSSFKDQGGGVLLDLSHEIDYVQFLVGNIKNIFGLGGHLSSLKGDSEDSYSFLAQAEDCTHLSVSLNYLDRITQRVLTVITENKTYHLDFISNTLKINDKSIMLDVNRNTTYTAQAKTIMENNLDQLCSFEDSIYTLKVIDSLKNQKLKSGWVNL